MSAQDWGKIYKDLGVQPIVNATGSVTLLGGSTPIPEVKVAMDAADDAYVPLIELEKAVGDYIAQLAGVPAAYITSGAGSALTLATAAFMAGADDDKIQQLPDTEGMPNEIIIQRRQRYWYDRCLELAGARLTDAGDEEGTSADDLRRAITENTAAVHYPVFEQEPVDPNILTLEEVIEIAAEENKPVMVDAAGQVYPLENIGKYVRMGAKFQAVAAKYIGAPHSTGIALGTEKVIDAISRHSFVGYETRRIRGIGRPQKVDRQEIVGAFAAAKTWFSTNHEERLVKAERQSKTIVDAVQGMRGVQASIIDNVKAHQPFGVQLNLEPSEAGLTNAELVMKLKECDPPIWTRVPEGHESIIIHVFGLAEGEDKIVGDCIVCILKSI